MAITVVQEPTMVIADGVTSVSFALPSNVTSGNLVVVEAARYAGGADAALTAANCTKSAGTATIGTITLDKQQNVASSNPNQAGVWSAPVTGTGSLTVAVAGPSGSYFAGTIGEYSGTDVSISRVEATNANTATAATSPATTGNASSAGEALFIACVSIDGLGNSTLNPTPGNSFTATFAEGDSSNHQCGAGARRIVTTGTTTQGSWTISTTGLAGWAACVVVYKVAAGGGGGFQSAWARGANTVISNGARAA